MWQQGLGQLASLVFWPKASDKTLPDTSGSVVTAQHRSLALSWEHCELGASQGCRLRPSSCS